MKVKMKETYQGVGQTAVLLDEGITVAILEEGESYEVGLILGAWLVDNGKAEEIAAPVHYGAQAEPELRQDDKKYKEMIGEIDQEPLAAPVSEDEPIMTSEKTPKRSKRSK